MFEYNIMADDYKNLFKNLSRVNSSAEPLTLAMKKRYTSIFITGDLRGILKALDVAGAQMSAIETTIVIIASNLMNAINTTATSGGMLSMRAQRVSTRRLIDQSLNHELHGEVIERQEERRRNSPSGLYIFTLCILFSIGVVIVYFIYIKLIKLSSQINEATNPEDYAFFNTLKEVMEENTDQVGEGFMHYIWKTLSNMAGLKNVPTQAHLTETTRQLVANTASELAQGISRNLVRCGHEMTPIRQDFQDGVVGAIKYKTSLTATQMVNVASGIGPFQCAAALTSSKVSINIAKIMADAAINVSRITSQIAIIHTLFGLAVSVFGFTIPALALAIKNSNKEDVALLELRNGDSYVSNRDLLDAGTGTYIPEVSNSLTIGNGPEVLTIGNGLGVRRRRHKQTKRKPKQTKRKPKQTKQRR